ncbi:MAG: hypothetical protein AAFO99_00570 [Bacteroidota bacterium]
MNNQIRITILWLLLVLGITIHTVIETGEALFFAPLPEEPYGEGIPMFAHVIYLASMILPMLFTLLTLFFSSKAFKIVSLVFASLLTLLHIFHVLEDGSLENITQLLLLSFIAISSALLVITLVKWLRKKPEPTE